MLTMATGTVYSAERHDLKPKVDLIERYVNSGKLDSAQQILKLIEKDLNKIKSPEALSRYHYGLGLYLTQSEELDSAIIHLNLAKDKALNAEQVDSVHLAKIYGTLCAPYELTGDKESALQNILEAVRIAEELGPGKIKETGKYYRQIAVTHLYTGDIDKAKYYLKKAENYYANYAPDNISEKLVIGSTLAFTLLQQRETNEAIKKYRELIEYSNKLNLPEQNNLSLYIGLGIGLREAKKYDEALAVTQKSESIALKYLGPTHRALGDIWNIIGNVLFELGKYKQAKTYVNKTLKNRISLVGEISYFSAEQYWTLGKIELKQGNTSQAIKEFNKALNSLNYKFNDPSFFLRKRNYTALTNSLTLLNKGYIDKYLKDGEQKDLTESIRLAKESMFALDQMRSNFYSMGSKEFLVRESYTIYENAIHTKFLEYTQSKDPKVLQQALELMEQSKMQSLQESARESGYTFEDKIPDETIKSRNAIRTQLQQTIDAIDASEEKDSILDKKYLEFTDALNKINKTIREDYVSHYNFIAKGNALDLDALNETVLNDSTIVLEYFLGDDYLFRLCIGQNDMKLHRQKLPSNFKETVNSFRQFTSSYDAQGSQSVLNSLSNILLKDLTCLDENNIKHIKIIPDEFLWHIPFEILNKVHSSTALITDYTISYANSLKLLLHQNELSHNSNGKILAFVPEYKNSETGARELVQTRNSLGTLHGTKKEVQKILELLPGRSFLGRDAIKANFIEQASTYEVLHLAMHTLPDSKNNPNLIFNQNEESTASKLSFAELSGMEINSNLAVISACKSGVGKIKRGTGIESLSQAFTYAGVPSTVMSLWNVPDESTAKVMVNFYTHLANGVNKADALRKAKLDYIADDSVPDSKKHYNYWAGFIVEGNLDSIQFTKASPISKYGLLLLGFLLIFGSVLYKLRKN